MPKTTGIILKLSDQGESDRFLTVLTFDFGKLSFLTKAARKITSKLRGGIQPFSLNYLEFISGKTNKIITDAIILENFSGIKNDLKKLQAGFYICRLLDKFLKENENDENIWNLAVFGFHELENMRSDSVELGKFLRYFEFKLVKFLGHMPELYCCVECGNKIKEEPNLFSMASGGLVCHNCRKEKKIQNIEGIKINAQTIKISRICFEKDLDFLKRLKIEEQNLENLKQVSGSILSYLMEEKAIFPE